MSNSEQSNNPITLEKWTNNSNGQTVTVIRGILTLEFFGSLEDRDRVLVVYPDRNAQVDSLEELKNAGYILQSAEASPHPPAGVPAMFATYDVDGVTCWDVN
jgi:hypothetical protein